MIHLPPIGNKIERSITERSKLKLPRINEIN